MKETVSGCFFLNTVYYHYFLLLLFLFIRRWSRDHSTRHKPFPIDGSLEPSPYLQLFSRYFALWGHVIDVWSHVTSSVSCIVLCLCRKLHSVLLRFRPSQHQISKVISKWVASCVTDTSTQIVKSVILRLWRNLPYGNAKDSEWTRSLGREVRDVSLKAATHTSELVGN